MTVPNEETNTMTTTLALMTETPEDEVQPEFSYILSQWSDKECLDRFFDFTTRIHLSNSFIPDKDGLITHQTIIVTCGEEGMESGPIFLSTPLKLATTEDLNISAGELN